MTNQKVSLPFKIKYGDKVINCTVEFIAIKPIKDEDLK